MSQSADVWSERIRILLAMVIQRGRAIATAPGCVLRAFCMVAMAIIASGTLDAQAPSGLVYPTNPWVMTYGIGGANVPTLASGTANSYSISPPLPSEMTLSTSTGQITCLSPNLCLPPTVYTITAKNSSNQQTTASLTITINPIPITYTTNPVVYTKNTAIAQNSTPTINGLSNVSFTVPNGLLAFPQIENQVKG